MISIYGQQYNGLIINITKKIILDILKYSLILVIQQENPLRIRILSATD